MATGRGSGGGLGRDERIIREWISIKNVGGYYILNKSKQTSVLYHFVYYI